MRILAKFIGFEGSYLRFEGSAAIEKIENGEVIKASRKNPPFGGLMYFGKASADKK